MNGLLLLGILGAIGYIAYYAGKYVGRYREKISHTTPKSILCRLGKHSYIVHWDGYRPYRQVWTTIKYCKRCGKSLCIGDDLFAPSRDSAWGNRVPENYFIGTYVGEFVCGTDTSEAIAKHLKKLNGESCGCLIHFQDEEDG